MSVFSLSEALEKLILDPFHTKSYRNIIQLLKNLKMMVKYLHDVKVCSLEDVLEKLSIAPEKKMNSFASSANIERILEEMQVQNRVNDLLVKLLSYLLFKLKNISSDGSFSLLQDFKDLKDFICVFRNYSKGDHQRMDEIVAMFLQKLFEFVKCLNLENCKNKHHMASIARIMIMEFAKEPIYASIIVQQLQIEFKHYFEKVDSFPTGYGFEAYFTLLYILNENIAIIFNNLMDNSAIIELKDHLKGVSSRLELSQREGYLIQNILRVIDVFLNTLQ